MRDIYEKTHPLSRLYAEVEALAVYGNNSVLRRALSTIEAELIKQGVESRGGVVFDPKCLPDGSCGPQRCGEAFSLDDATYEYRQDDRRRSVFIDPEEVLTANLIDFYTGRLDVLEVRNPDWKIDVNELEQKARTFMRAKYPVVSVDHALASSREEAVAILRALADRIESGEQEKAAHELMGQHAMDTVTISEECRPLRTEVANSRWIENNRILQHLVREIVECKKRDACCWNNTYVKVASEQWQTVWSGSEDRSTPPPQLPPNFPPEPWNNRLPILNDPNIGTLTSRYGWRQLPNPTRSDFHGGVDIAAPVGTSVRAIFGGQVVHINSTGGHEVGVVIRNGNQTHTYWHINPAAGLQEGAQINAGTALGTIAAGERIHVHYAVHEPPNGDWNQRSDFNSRPPFI